MNRKVPRWARLVFVVALNLSWIQLLWAGSSTIGRDSLGVGLLILGVGAVTAYLAIRWSISFVRSPEPTQLAMEATGPEFDYLIWMAVGLPLVLVLGLLVFVLANQGK